MRTVVRYFTAKFLFSRIAGLLLLQPAREELPAGLFRLNVCPVAIWSSLPLGKEGTCSGGRCGASQLIQEQKQRRGLVAVCAELLQAQAGVVLNGSRTWWGGSGCRCKQTGPTCPARSDGAVQSWARGCSS